jgi:Predicted transcriptional regulators
MMMQKNEETTENIALTEAVYYVLLSVIEPMHGYGIMKNVSALSNNRVNLAPGTLYGAIETMLKRNWISALPGEKNSRKKEYQITKTGKIVLDAEIQRLRELLSNGEQIVEGRV